MVVALMIITALAYVGRPLLPYCIDLGPIHMRGWYIFWRAGR